MPTKQQMLNACDDIMKTKIKELLYNFWITSTEENLKESIEYCAEIFFKLVNMDKKYCQPKEV